MREKKVILWVLAIVCAVGLLALPSIAVAQESGGDHSEADACGSCHFNPKMGEVVGQWSTSQHANSYDDGAGSNTYCARCKSPFNADPLATYSDNVPVPAELWKDVTCSACHPPHDLRVEWDTPIGTYDITTGEWAPVYDPDELCVYCHTGSHHARSFKAFGKTMFEKKGVHCNECHMAKVPSAAVPGDTIHTHSWLVEDNLPYSCGVEATGCHANKDMDWALKQIKKMRIHDEK
jgi:hypothetical protein